ncbi:MAG: 16S rRNA (cytidine(1402)-2'-O)-methyltransferase [Rhodospirillaceae bacterium]|nr:16S rRNA (cytidine(1402)-2'-O)-methyltransferase [Rhodospirillaceae bacterium]|tara:strand:+ start:1676 stop:2434 length:759 start_codon:yes stop_codon:yes gene_type:complete
MEARQTLAVKGGERMTGTLVLIGTPIGNLDDISSRVLATLGSLDALACEDTRRTRKLYEHFELDSPRTIFSCNDHNEDQAVKRMAGLLRQGLRVGLATDAGMPGISDPGYQAVTMATEEGFAIEVIPGPTAVASALALSGLSASSYTFLGFPPRKPSKRRNFLMAEAEADHTLVLFESPHRLGALLTDALDVLGDRKAAVCIELTKMYEETARGWLGDLAGRFTEETPRGEVTLVIAGKNRKFLRALGGEPS